MKWSESRCLYYYLYIYIYVCVCVYINLCETYYVWYILVNCVAQIIVGAQIIGLKWKAGFHPASTHITYSRAVPACDVNIFMLEARYQPTTIHIYCGMYFLSYTEVHGFGRHVSLVWIYYDLLDMYTCIIVDSLVGMVYNQPLVTSFKLADKISCPKIGISCYFPGVSFAKSLWRGLCLTHWIRKNDRHSADHISKFIFSNEHISI